MTTDAHGRLQEAKARAEEAKQSEIAWAQRMAVENRQRREAEAEQRRRQQEEEREAQAVAQLEAEKERQKRIWASCGNPAEEFEAAWPQIKQEILMERRRALLSRMDTAI